MFRCLTLKSKALWPCGLLTATHTGDAVRAMVLGIVCWVLLFATVHISLHFEELGNVHRICGHSVTRHSFAECRLQILCFCPNVSSNRFAIFCVSSTRFVTLLLSLMSEAHFWSHKHHCAAAGLQNSFYSKIQIASTKNKKLCFMTSCTVEPWSLWKVC